MAAHESCLGARQLVAALGFGVLALAACTPMAPTAGTNGSSLSFAQIGDSEAELELGLRLTAGSGVNSDPAAGAAIVERRARTGDHAAEYTIAELYFSGVGVDKNPATAATWMQRAADGHYAPAEAELAAMYLNGLGVDRDPARGFKLAQEAAARGSAEGAEILGTAYAKGWGVPEDDAEAMRWFHKAADKNDPNAMINLGVAYRDGKGVARDNVVAEAWLMVAVAHARSGVAREHAIRERDNLALNLLPGEQAQARDIAAAWQPGADLAAKRGPVAANPAPADGAPSAAGNQANSTAPVPVAADAVPRNANPPIVVRLQTFDIEVQADGSSTRTVHSEFAIKNEAAAKSAAQLPLWFNDTISRLDIAEAYTLKADGRKLAVNPAAIYTQLRPGASSAPMFDDLKQKVVVFPDVQAGDVLVVTSKLSSKAYIPGFYQAAFMFDPTAAYEDARITIKAPKALPLAVETHDLKFAQRNEGDHVVYEWRYAATNPVAENITALDGHDRWPRLFASSLRNYDALARAYAAIAEPKSAVTPKIQKLADQITQGISDRRGQAEAIYYWVSRNIRYVGVEIGDEAIVPHGSDMVLDNGYGDCKDHSVLFAALLKAKGIASNVVLINLGTSYSFAQAPTFATLNHAITWLPEFNLYADTTAGVAPFGVLPFQEYGKPVVIATASGPAVRRTPLLPPDSASVTVKTTARLAADGKISGDSETVATGPFAIILRQTAAAIQSLGEQQAAKQALRNIGYEGTGNFTFGSPFEVAPSFRIGGHFEANPHPEFLAGTSFYPPLGLILGNVPGDGLLGSLNFRDVTGSEPTPCFSGREVEELSIELPEGKHLREVPKGMAVTNDYMSYQSAWSVAGRTVTVRREFSATLDQPVCVGAVRQTAAKSLNDIRKDYNTALALVDN